jgi:hypothetical protein
MWPQVCAGRINWDPSTGEWVDTGCAISPVSAGMWQGWGPHPQQQKQQQQLPQKQQQLHES